MSIVPQADPPTANARRSAYGTRSAILFRHKGVAGLCGIHSGGRYGASAHIALALSAERPLGKCRYAGDP